MEHYRKSSSHQIRYQKNPGDGWLHILLFYMLPFIVFNGLLFFCVTAKPAMSITVADTNDYLSTEITVAVTSKFPSGEPTVTLDGEPLELVKGKNRTYKTTVYKNGSIEANVKNMNGMTATVFEHVSVLDDNPPSMENTSVTDGVLTLTVTDSQSGINFDSIYALDSSNERVEPLTVNRSTNTISYEMDPAGLQVFAMDRAGNEVHGSFTSRKEGDTETLESEMIEPEIMSGEKAEAETSAAGEN